MKKSLNLILSILSLFAAAPTGWAIFAGITEQRAFPIWTPAAIAGAVAVIATSITAGLLIVDILSYNQTMKNKTEREELSMPVRPAWLVLIGCVLAEVTLSLLIVVIPGLLAYGVVVFPLMTIAGVFAFAIRYDLQQREATREQVRLNSHKPKATAEQPAKSRSAARSAKKKAAQSSLSDFPCPNAGAGCPVSKPTQNAINAHAGRCKFKPTIAMPLYNVSQQASK